MADNTALLDVLHQLRERGALGEADLPGAIAHADRFVAALPDSARRLIDLGSGGGLPGLVIAIRRPELDVVLVDRRARRTDLLRLASSQLDLAARVTVLDADVVALGGDPKYTRSFDVVTARAFGEPLWTLECAAPFLRPGGFCIVSEPPPAEITRDRWPGESVTELGFAPSPLQFPGVRRFERW